ncbi:MAG: B12-binding domain-containing radical SAM protein [bacterium]|nr:B12-binding domain-containing radical SAM protein [bacterium]
MKVTFITPAIGKRPGQKYIKSWRVMEPLTIATLKAFTPPHIETEFFDDRVELIDFDTETDLVAITVETYTSYRAYTIAKRFRDRGITVVMGGYHPTTLPDEVAEHADCIVLGNAEGTWEKVLEDFENNSLKKRYVGTQGYSDILPDRSIYAHRKYSILGLVETGRGCSFNCGFCAITSYYKGRYYPREIERVVADIKNSGKNYFFFIDDNIVANQEYALELCKAIAPLKIKWSSQGSLTMAKNPELLKWLKKSGCDVLLIGIESLEEENLKQMKKEWNAKMGEQDKLIQKIHDAGLSIYATFVFGFDYDTPATFQKAIDFSMKHGFYFAAYNHVTPFPATPLYDQLKKEGRLLMDKWWLDTSYKYGYLPFRPKSMTHEDVKDLCAQARRDFFKTSAIFKRWFKLLKRNKNPILSYLFLDNNLMLQREVDQRLELPIGTGLDEMPK